MSSTSYNAHWAPTLVRSLSTLNEASNDAITDAILRWTAKEDAEFARTFTYSVQGSLQYVLEGMQAVEDWPEWLDDCFSELFSESLDRRGQIEVREHASRMRDDAAGIERLKKCAQIRTVFTAKQFDIRAAEARAFEDWERKKKRDKRPKNEPLSVGFDLADGGEDEFEEAMRITKYVQELRRNRPLSAGSQQVPLLRLEVGTSHKVRAAERKQERSLRRSMAKYEAIQREEQRIVRLWMSADKPKVVSAAEKPSALTRLSARQVWAKDIQVGVNTQPDGPSRRAQRDAAQRKAAKAKAEAARKAVPKAERERKVREARDKRVPGYESQSGKVLPTVMTVAFTLVGVKLASGIKTLASKIGDLAVNTRQATRIIHRHMSGILEALDSAVQGFKRAVGKAIWMVPLAIVLYYVFNQIKAPMPLLVSSFGVIGLSLFGGKFWNCISKFFRSGDTELLATLERDDVPELQSGYVTGLAKLAATAMTFSVFGGKMSMSTVGEFCRRISTLDRLAGGWESFMTWSMQAIEAMVNFVRQRFGRDEVRIFKTANQECYKWMRAVDAIAREQETAAEQVTPEIINRMIALVKEGYDLKEVYRGHESMTRVVTTYVAKISGLVSAHLGSVNARNNFRFEPAMVCLLGAPGIGKSMMAVPFCAAILLGSGLLPPDSTPDQVTQEMFQKDNGQYWNGYDGQLVNIMDDIFQQRADISNLENEYMTLIRAIGSWSFPLNMADVTSKGKYYYTSKVVFATTNVRSIRSEAAMVLNEPEAVARRISFPYQIELKPYYRTVDGRLDLAKFEQERERVCALHEGIDRFPWHVWDAKRHNFLTGETSAQIVPLRMVLQEIIEGIRSRMENFTVGKAAINNFIDGISQVNERRREPEVELQVGGLFGRRRPERHEVELNMIPVEEPQQDFAGWFEQGGPPPEVAPEVAERFDRWAAREILRRMNDVVVNVENDRNSLRRFVKSIALGFGAAIAIRLLISLAKQVAMVIASGLGFTLRAFVRPKKKNKVKSQSNVPTKVRSKAVSANHPTLQAGDVAVVTNVYSNTYKMSVSMQNGSAQYFFGQVCFLTGTLAVQPEHFVAELVRLQKEGVVDEDAAVTLVNVLNTQFKITTTVRRYLELPMLTDDARDVCFVDYRPLGVRAHRNVVGNFAKEGDLRFLSGVLCRLDVCDFTLRNGVPAYDHKVYIVDKITSGKDLRFNNRRLDRYFEYKAPTETGDCGAPLSIVDNASYSGRTVVGIHVAGQVARGVGYSAIITQEMIQNAVKHFGAVVDDFTDDLKSRGISFQSGDTFCFPEMGTFLPIGTLERAVNLSPKTAYFVNKGIYGKFGEYDYYPAPLRPVYRDGELKYPMLNAVAPYQSTVYAVDTADHAQATHVAFSRLTHLTRGSPRVLYTFEEAILGVPQEKFRSLPRNTAAGFPYCYDYKDGKRSFFGVEEEYDLTGPLVVELKARVDKIVGAAKNNERLAHVFVDFLKDELRSSKKVYDVRTRLISSAPMDYTIAWRMYFGAFSAAVMKNHTKSGMAPGICCFTDWDILANMVRKKSEKVFDGDFTAFDSSELPVVMDSLLTYINNWYDDGEENARVRRVLWEDLCHSRHVGGNGLDQRYLYQWNKSLPSGHPFTTIVNSMYSLFAIVLCYIKITGDRVGFWEHVSAVTYGDDNVVNVDDEVCERFNQCTLAEAMWEHLRLVYTSSKKEGELEPYTTLGDVSFLKRRIIFDGGYWKCPLELDSFLYSCYWCKNKRLRLQITHDELENSLQELSMHDSQVWGKYAKKIGDLLSSLGYVTMCPVEQSEYLRYVQTRADAWY